MKRSNFLHKRMLSNQELSLQNRGLPRWAIINTTKVFNPMFKKTVQIDSKVLPIKNVYGKI